MMKHGFMGAAMAAMMLWMLHDPIMSGGITLSLGAIGFVLVADHEGQRPTQGIDTPGVEELAEQRNALPACPSHSGDRSIVYTVIELTAPDAP